MHSRSGNETILCGTVTAGQMDIASFPGFPFPRTRAWERGSSIFLTLNGWEYTAFIGIYGRLKLDYSNHVNVYAAFAVTGRLIIEH